MFSEKTKSVIVEIISALLVLLFCYAAISKLLDVRHFVVQMGKSPLLKNFAGILSWLVPASELIIASLLIFKVTRLTGLYLSLFLMIMFTTYIIIILNFSTKIPCSCGGVLQGLSWRAHLVFNAAFLVLTIIGIVLQSKARVSTFNAPYNPLITGEAENL